VEPIVLCFGSNAPDPVLLAKYHEDWERYLPFDGVVFPLNDDRVAGMYGDHGANTGIPGYQSPLHLAFGGQPFSHWWPTWLVTQDEEGCISPAFGPQRGNCPTVWGHFSRSIKAAQRCCFKRFTHNFLPLVPSGGGPGITQPGAPGASWLITVRPNGPNSFQGWKNTQDNVRQVAQLAKNLGCKGLFIDPEDYTNYGPFNYGAILDFLSGALFGLEAFRDSGLACPESLAHTKGWSGQGICNDWSAWEHNRRVVRDRAFELMKIINKEFPDIVIILSEGLSGFCNFDATVNAVVPFFSSSEALLPQFVDGLIAGADPGTVIVDGCECHYQIHNQVPAESRSLMVRKLVDMVKGKTPELLNLSLDPNTYSDRIRVGLSIYYEVNQGAPLFGHDAFRKQCDLAFRYTDKYVWLWTEYHPPWTIDRGEWSEFTPLKWPSEHPFNWKPNGNAPAPTSEQSMFPNFAGPIPLAFVDMLESEKEAFMTGYVARKYKLQLQDTGTPAGLESRQFSALPSFTGHAYVIGPDSQAVFDILSNDQGQFQYTPQFLQGANSQPPYDDLCATTACGAATNNPTLPTIILEYAPNKMWQFKNLAKPNQFDPYKDFLYVVFVGVMPEDI
jgi:hypothetical protein